MKKYTFPCIVIVFKGSSKKFVFEQPSPEFAWQQFENLVDAYNRQQYLRPIYKFPSRYSLNAIPLANIETIHLGLP